MNDVCDKLTEIQRETKAKAIVLDFSLVTGIDFTAIYLFEQLARDFAFLGVRLFATHVHSHIQEVCDGSCSSCFREYLRFFIDRD